MAPRPPLPPSPNLGAGVVSVVDQAPTPEAPPASSYSLTLKQQRFCREYHATGNATLSAKRAGYSEKTAASIGSENLTKPEILAEIERLKSEEHLRYRVTADKLVRHLSMQALADRRAMYDEHGNLRPPHEWPEDLAASLDGVKEGKDGDVVPVLLSRKVAQESLSKHLGIYEADNTQRGTAVAEGLHEAAAAAGDLEFARRLAWLLTQAAAATPPTTGEPQHG